MARITDQSIPSSLHDLYHAALETQPWIYDYDRVTKRHPFRIPELQGCRTIRPWVPKGAKVTAAMALHRYLFGPCVECFNKQPWSGGAEPDGRGPYSRTWWFNEAIGKLPWYYNYFMRRTIDAHLGAEPPLWCAENATDDAEVNSENPDGNYGQNSVMYVKLSNGNKRWSYINPPAGKKVSWCHLRLVGIRGPNDPDGPWSFNVYASRTNWAEGTITWNNKPPLVFYRKTLTITDPTAGKQKYYSFHIGQGNSCVITASIADTEVWFSTSEGQAAWKPFWT